MEDTSQLVLGPGLPKLETVCRASPLLYAPSLVVVLVFIFTIYSFSIQYPSWLQALFNPFKTFLTVDDAEEIIAQAEQTGLIDGAKPAPTSEPEPAPSYGALWRTIILTVFSLLESLAWLALGSYRAYTFSKTPTPEILPIYIALPFVTALTWLYACLRSFTRYPRSTPPYDLFTLFLVYFTAGCLDWAVLLYEKATMGWPWPQRIVLAAMVWHWITVLLLLIVILRMPLGVESARVQRYKKDGGLVMEEDYTSLWGWITFSWVVDLINRGTEKDLEEKDVPELSPSLQSKPVYQRFMEFQRSTLLRQIFWANSLDVMLGFVLAFVYVVFSYSSPFFLKLILDTIEATPDPPSFHFRSRAYIYALLMFLAGVGKAEACAQLLWFGRRASTRARSELMATIYVKALRRKDFSGVVEKDNESKDKQQKSEDGGNRANNAGADTGKIVQLMAADANHVANMFAFAHVLYGAPMEIAIASFMLYRLLGSPAFVGFGVLVLASPLSHLLSKRGATIGRGLSAARDKRMSVINELIGGIKFIKFFAWEPQWIKRTLDARDDELKWLIKDRINSTLFSLLWALAPTFVSIVSFLLYVWLGNELSIATAFTAIALFNMLKIPLNDIPQLIVPLLQAGISLDRISVFLQEEEVSDYVSTFKCLVLTNPPTSDETKIGFTGGACFIWEKAKEKRDTIGKGMGKGKMKRKASIPVFTATGEGEPSTSMTEAQFELRDVDVLFPVGKLTLVVGPIASGKSALLMALLGEMTPVSLSGDSSSPVHLPKHPYQLEPSTGLYNCISYCAQSPWLEHATIRDNILFYSPYEEERYREVIGACALRPDLDILEDGDRTEIGARGVSLSGGQKARVALARAVYARTKHVILDDPLAAVDSHTARHLYENVLLGPLMKERTCILVTHHVDLVRPGAQYLVRMLDGRIDTKGSIKDLEDQGVLHMIIEDSELERRATENDTKTPSDDAETVAEAAAEEKAAEDVQPVPNHTRLHTDATAVATRGPLAKRKARKLVKDEERAKGNVKWKIYTTYLEAAGWFTWVWLMIFVVGYQGIGIIEKLWIKVWGEHYHGDSTVLASNLRSTYGVDHSDTTSQYLMSFSALCGLMFGDQESTLLPGIPELPSAHEHPLFYVGIYAGIGVCAAFVSVSDSIVQYWGSYKASKLLFKRLLDAVVGSPMRFFDTTPAGRILNRFSKDVETVDSSLSGSLRNTLSWVATLVASILTVVVVLPQFFLPGCLVAYSYYRLSYGYIITGRSLRRMESTTRSPIFAAFGDMLEGLVTVRAFAKEEKFIDATHRKIDLTTKMLYCIWMTNRWLLLCFDTLGAFSTLVATLFALSRLDAGLAGLTITSAMAYTMSVYWTCRMVTQLEMDLNSVERVVEYLDLPQEPAAIIESNRVPAYWPSSESNQLIVVEDLVIRYSPELPAVLHDVSFQLKPKERVGLLGRTGSGKSTLAMALLRFVDPSSGKIIIDGIDISTIGLHDLRSRVMIIPQDAVLFSGTMRENLDPFNEHSDEECLDALERVRINGSTPASRRTSRAPSIHGKVRPDEVETASIVTTKTGTTQYDDQKHAIGLKSKVSTGGTNFSQGQRQLITMARALLRRSSIIIMDEATSSIDFHTDALVQRTIREEFSNSLLITIAHRIRTIIDYDRLIVLDQGRIVEFDTPLNLIQREGGVFRGMCLKSGHFEELLVTCSAKKLVG
ncbi:hypothetical protein M407DRAFT_22914 [Tulasnella calospora MUT 4182]|uniref:Uncharacterized protein n=1 Tax=Tulasnella calospora MUT 4182 TaxID=1051891 RepID=A0A0C3QKH9_9AGAM|nr:hypothetical protein M407DRAFT_22914 [Tulasnella calospora MUT 4182]